MWFYCPSNVTLPHYFHAKKGECNHERSMGWSQSTMCALHRFTTLVRILWCTLGLSADKKGESTWIPFSRIGVWHVRLQPVVFVLHCVLCVCVCPQQIAIDTLQLWSHVRKPLKSFLVHHSWYARLRLNLCHISGKRHHAVRKQNSQTKGSQRANTFMKACDMHLLVRHSKCNASFYMGG